jgi:hypothetical protein
MSSMTTSVIFGMLLLWMNDGSSSCPNTFVVVTHTGLLQHRRQPVSGRRVAQVR